MKILILDDDPFIARLIQIQLRALSVKSRGFNGVVTCTSGAQAVEVLRKSTHSYGLVLCDLKMPSMDGVQFVRHLADMGYRGALAFISGTDAKVLQSVEQLARAHRLNALGSLAKPVRPEQLSSILDRAGQPGAQWSSGADNVRVYSAEELEHAIGEEQLVNHYQPKVDLRTGEVTGMEALVRWNHPDEGLVLPSAFIPLAESSGLITELGTSVLHHAVRDASGWQAAGMKLDVAVNISMANLQCLDFPDHVAELGADFGLPLERLVFEITESRLMAEPRAQLDILSRLRLKGVRLAIDDFGTGYSCLMRLRELPFSELKIDRGFVNGSASDASLRAILEAALGLAHELGIKTVAEGVETHEDWAYLRGVGCDLAQGFFIARAMPSGQVNEWIDDWRQRQPSLVA